jgi:hypothetical protein
MTERLLRVAVVGHTNTGKTSLLRTLARDADFGEVSDRPGTTRSPSACPIVAHGRIVMELIDTPGLEDPVALLARLHDLGDDRRFDGPRSLQRLLESEAATREFAPEAAAIREVLRSDAALYVIDAREHVRERHRDELSILGFCARPVVSVLNFTADPTARSAAWREQLARVNMHAVAEFDTVVLEAGGEIRLFEKMRSLLDARRDAFDAIIDDRRRERRSLVTASARAVAELVIDAAAFAVEAAKSGDGPDPAVLDRVHEAIRARETECVRDLLRLHRFRPDDCVARPLPIEDGAWRDDLFSPEAIQQIGASGGKGAAAGAAVGLTLDLAVGGLSLGAATALGAAVGAAIGAGAASARDVLARVRGRVRIRCDDSTLARLIDRQCALIVALLHRGHAAFSPVVLHGESARTVVALPRHTRSREEDLRAAREEALRLAARARRRPVWSRVTLAGSDPARAARAAPSVAETAAHAVRHVVATFASQPSRDDLARRIAETLAPPLQD